jgi:hypothetical protein
VRRAAQQAALRIGQLTDHAPRGAAVMSGSGGVHAVVDHHLARPRDYVGSLDQTSGDVRFGADHQAGFATGGHGDWTSWQAGADGRTTGHISSEGVAGAALLLLGGSRRRRRTALQTAGLDPATLQRPARRGDGTAAQSAGGWRTNLTGRPRTGAGIRVWSGGHAGPAAPAAPVVPEAAAGAVPHSGPPIRD